MLKVYSKKESEICSGKVFRLLSESRWLPLFCIRKRYPYYSEGVAVKHLNKTPRRTTLLGATQAGNKG